MKTLLLIILTFSFSACEQQKTANTKAPAKTASTRESRQNYVAFQKKEMPKYNIDIDCLDAECENLKMEPIGVTLSQSLETFKPNFEKFKEMGFKQVRLIGSDGEQTIDLAILNK